MKKIAYLINRYPAVSHTFIRREILALEALGCTVLRYSIRSTAGEVTDPADLLESKQTRSILNDSKLYLIYLTLITLALKPVLFTKALTKALTLGWHSNQGTFRHLAYLVEACALCHSLRTENVSHVHAHFGTNSTTVAMLCRMLGGPEYSFTVHGPEEFDRPESLDLGTKIQHARFVIAISNYGKSQLFRWCTHRDWPKIHVVHCGVDDSYLHHVLTPVPDTNRLVCVGRLCEQKGQLLLLEAVSLLVQQGTSIQLALVGDGEMRTELESLASRLRITNNIEFLGWKTGAEVRDELLQSRALVLPSFAEGLPVVIMEALALGRPVISTYIAGIPELVTPGECGWLVPAGDVVALANAMQQLLTASSVSLTEMGICGRQQVLERHSIHKEAAKIANLLPADDGIHQNQNAANILETAKPLELSLT